MIYLRWIFSYIKRKKYLFFLGLFFAAGVGILSTIPAKVSGAIVDKVLISHRKELLLGLLGLYVLIFFIISIIRYSKEMIFERISQDFTYKLRLDLYSNMQNLDQSFYNTTSTGELMSKMTGDITQVRHTIAWVFQNFVESFSLFIFSIITLFTVDAKLAGILMPFLPVAFFVNYKLSIKVKPLYSRIRNEFTNLTKYAQENIDANRVVKTFVREDYETERFMKQNQNFMDSNIKAAFVNTFYSILINLVTNLMILTTVLLGAFFTIKGDMTIGEFSIFLSLAWMLDYPIKMSIILSNDYQRFLASAQKLTPLFYAKPQISSPHSAYIPKEPKGEIIFDNVSLTIDGKKILSNVSFEIKPGQTVAMMGPIGSGKTMIINLMLRLYDPDSGRILIDGVDIKEYNLQALRKIMGVAPQDVFLFSETITNNIAYSDPFMPDEKIFHYSSQAQAHSFILKTPQGYDTIVGERGVGLSGGQKQRIALARALAVNSPVLILDDTTSAVDLDTEKKIQEALALRAQNQSTIIVAQRISSVRHADNIIILENGIIAEQGRHEDLIKSDNYYRQVYALQADVCAAV